MVISELHVNMDHVSPEYALVMKHPTKQNHLQPPKTSQNHPRPAKTTHNHPKPPKTTNNYPKPPTTKWFEIIIPRVENFFLLSIWFYSSYKTIFVIIILKSGRSQVLFKIGVPKIIPNFTGKGLCWSLFWIKLQPKCVQLY